MKVARQARADRILEALATPCAACKIVRHSKLGRTTVWRWLKRMHEAGEVHVVDWAPELGGPVPVYALGPGADVPCTIVPATTQQRTRKSRYRARMSEGYHKRVEDAVRASAVEAAKRATYTSDPLMAALFKSAKSYKPSSK